MKIRNIVLSLGLMAAASSARAEISFGWVSGWMPWGTVPATYTQDFWKKEGIHPILIPPKKAPNKKRQKNPKR